MAKKKLNILYQDENYIAVEKPAGILVHPYKERSKDRRSLMRSLKAQTDLYLYPIHRLDNNVSGVVIFGLSSEATKLIKENWNTENTTKKYIALVRGETDQKAQIDFALTNDHGVKQEACTVYDTLMTKNGFSLIDIEIKTGRKHQIRRHLSRRMNNIVGDAKYGNGLTNKYFRKKYKFYRLFLHSYELSFMHPYTGQSITIECPLPEELAAIQQDFESGLINIKDGTIDLPISVGGDTFKEDK